MERLGDHDVRVHRRAAHPPPIVFLHAKPILPRSW
jgi:hypothetical protein